MAHTGKRAAAKTCAEDRHFEESWRAVHRALYRRALYLTRGNQDEAKDLFSITAIKSLRILRRFPEPIRNPQGFFFLVLRHVHLDSARRNMREKQIFDEGTTRRTEEGEEEKETVREARVTQTPLDVLLVMERLEEIFRAVCRLNPKQRQLFELAFLNERAYPEIAEALGISAMLARKRVQVLREKLRGFAKS